MLEAMFDLPVETLTLCAVLVFTLTEYFWKAYLSYRQRRIYRSTTCVPQELCNFEDPRTFAKLRIYHLEQSSFSFWFDLLSEIIWVVRRSIKIINNSNFYKYFTLRFP
uniref:CAAX prenyl protease 1 N-terminal domain-containing protein n=1 Tax=Kryptolebias marmoratus TaxID=37003 RepID=A0A3Q3A7N4_KRYMA